MKSLGHGLWGYANLDEQAYRIRHESVPQYEVAVKFGYAKESKYLISEVAADKELWLLVKGALIHTMTKESNN